MPVERESPGETDPDIIRARLGLPPSLPSKPKTDEDILAHLRGEKPADPVDPAELQTIAEAAGFFNSLMGNRPPGK